MGQADQEGHRQQEPLGPGQGDRGLHQKGVPRQGKQIRVVFIGIYFLLPVLLAYGTRYRTILWLLPAHPRFVNKAAILFE